MESSRLSRRALIGAGAVTLLGPAILAQPGRAALPSASTPAFSPHPAVKQAMQQGWSGIFNVADVANVSTLLLVVNGAATEVHARRAGAYLPKNAGSTSVKIVSTARYDQLLHLTGGPDRAMSTAQEKLAFTTLLDSPEGPAAPRLPTQTCPADFAAMKPIVQLNIKNHLSDPANQKYAPCFGAPLTSRDLLEDLFGAPAAHAADDRLVYFTLSADNFFSQWIVTYDPDGGFYGFNLFGLKAIWQIGG